MKALMFRDYEMQRGNVSPQKSYDRSDVLKLQRGEMQLNTVIRIARQVPSFRF